MRTRPTYDIFALLARIGVGIVFIGHGWQKLQVGLTATGDSFDSLGVPAPAAAAIYATLVELVGGLALVVGLGVPITGTLLFLDMVGALIFVHAGHGLFLVDQGKVQNGFELVMVLALASLLFAAGGAGNLTLDHRLFGARRRHEDDFDDGPGPWLPPEDEEPEPAKTAGRFRRKEAEPTESPVTPHAAPTPALEPTSEPTPAPATRSRFLSRRKAAGQAPVAELSPAPPELPGPDTPAAPEAAASEAAASAPPSADPPPADPPAADTPAEPTAPPRKAPAPKAKAPRQRKPSAPRRPAADSAAQPSGASGQQAPKPRLAADIINDDPGQDVRVAGKKPPA